MARKMKLTGALLLVLSLIWSCGSSEDANKDSDQIVPVGVSIVSLGKVTQSLQYTGDIRAEYQVKVFSKIPDRIDAIFVDEGDRVQKGQKIAVIAATTIEQSVVQAEAALAAARAQEANMRVEFERAKRLSSERAMSQQQYQAIQTQYEAAQAQMEQARAGLASAKSHLSDASITAPISGIIGRRYYEAGDMASPSMPLVSIVQMERVKIAFDAAEEDLGKLSTGQTATVKVRSFTDKVFTGKVTKISPVLDPQTRMAEVEVIIDNTGKMLKPGMYAEVVVETGIIDNVMVVPRYATIENTTMERIDGEDTVVKNYFVYTVENGRARQCKLDVRYVNHKTIAVNAGITVGDSLVIIGQNNLRDGMNVSIEKEEGNVL